MHRSKILISRLPEIITAIKQGHCSSRDTEQLAEICTSLATTLISYRIIRNSANQFHLGLSHEDIAADCVADLFIRRSDDEVPSRLRSFFTDIETEGLSPEAILVQLRTLVSYAVNNGLFRIYNECDPTLGKIIRNIKIYIKTSPILSIASRFGDNYIAAADVDACRHLPEMPQEVLEGKIAAIPSATSDIRSLMSHLAQIMVETNEYQRTIPLVSVAQVFRKHICVCDIPEDEIQEESQNLRTGDLKTIIRESCSQVSRSARQRYVAKGKVSAHLYDCYFSSIEKYLERLMAGTDGDPDSLYSVLVEFHPGLSKAEYRQYHKATLEYLARKCKKTCAGMMKRI